MELSERFCWFTVIAFLFYLQSIAMAVLNGGAKAQLTESYYSPSCPTVRNIVAGIVRQAVAQEARMAASLLRLHFHDCFVQGCDASILLDDTSTFTGEKTAPVNKNSVRGFEVIDRAKAAVEAACPAAVSCADILAIVAAVSVELVGGPSWPVQLGRRDSLTANVSLPDLFIPSPDDSLSTIVAKFGVVGLSEADVVALSGAHTIGRSRCVSFTNRLYNFSGTGRADPTINSGYLASLQNLCPENGANGYSVTNLDMSTPDVFDNSYYTNLLSRNGLLQSDEELYLNYDGTTTSIASLVEAYSSNQKRFFWAFAKSMIKMGNISPPSDSDGEIRLNCRTVNTN